MHAMQCMPHAKHEALNTTGPVPSHDFNLRVEPLDLDATEERLVDGESEQDNITAVEQARCRGQGQDRHGSDGNDGSDSELGTPKGGDKDDEVEPQIDENEPKEDPLAQALDLDHEATLRAQALASLSKRQHGTASTA